MTQIDWDEAPEGTEAAQEEANELYGCWFKKGADGEVWVIVIGQTTEWHRMGRKDFPYGHVMRPAPEKCAGKPPRNNAPWPSEAHPPVGTVCEMTTNDSYNWRPVRIIFFDEYVTMIGESEGKVNRELFKRCDADVAFRPMRTAEQIAADQYERDAEDLADIMKIHEPSDPLALAKLVLDCGYSKSQAR